jgi:hypothetical protein
LPFFNEGRAGERQSAQHGSEDLSLITEHFGFSINSVINDIMCVMDQRHRTAQLRQLVVLAIGGFP